MRSISTYVLVKHKFTLKAMVKCVTAHDWSGVDSIKCIRAGYYSATLSIIYSPAFYAHQIIHIGNFYSSLYMRLTDRNRNRSFVIQLFLIYEISIAYFPNLFYHRISVILEVIVLYLRYGFMAFISCNIYTSLVRLKKVFSGNHDIFLP